MRIFNIYIIISSSAQDFSCSQHIRDHLLDPKEKKRMKAYTGYIIIPAYRPDRVLPSLTTAVCDLGYHVIVVNDGSGEKHDPVFKALDPRVTLLSHEVNRGKGAALKTAFAYLKDLDALSSVEGADTSLCIVGTMDADGQHTPEDLVRVMDAAASSPGKLALGTRVIDKRMPLRSRFGNGLTRGLFRLLTGAKVSDTQTGLRAFDASQLSFMLSVEGDRYEYEMNVLSAHARKHGTRGFSEVPIQTIYRDEDNSTSHFHPIKDSIRIYRHLFKFAGSSFISFLVDYVLFILFSALFGLWIPAVSVTVANVSARVISAILNYNLNCRVVFEGKPNAHSALEYTLLAIFLLALNCGVLYLWGLTPIPIPICKLLTECCMFFVSYFIQKKIIFKKKNT